MLETRRTDCYRTLLIAVPSITYADWPIGIHAALVSRAVAPLLIGAVSIAAPGWWLQTMFVADHSSVGRVFLAGVFCSGIYLAVVVGLFPLTEPLRVGGRIVRDAWRDASQAMNGCLPRMI